MDTTTTDRTASPVPAGRVRRDLLAGLGLLGLVIGGHLLWFASDTGILAALG